MSIPRLSLCIVVRNEERGLDDCLASSRQVAADVLVVDIGSTDRSAAVANTHGARVVRMNWNGDFAEARNTAADNASGDWVLVLQPDERVASGVAGRIADALASNDFDVGLLPVHSAKRIQRPLEEALASEPRYLPRLFRKTPDLRWHGLVGESVDLTNKRIVRIDAPIIHDGADPEYRKAHNKDDLELELAERRRLLESGNPTAHALFAAALKRAGFLTRARAEVELARTHYRKKDRAQRGSGADIAVLLVPMQLLDRDFEGAHATLETLAADHPNLAHLRGRCFDEEAADCLDGTRRTELLVAAEREYRRCLDLVDGVWIDAEPCRFDTHIRLGTVLLRLRRPAEALEQFERVPPSAGLLDARLGGVEALVELGRHADALRELDPVLRVGDADAALLAACVCDGLGMPERQDWLARASELGAAALRGQHRRSRLVALETLERIQPLLASVGVYPDDNASIERGEEAFGAGDLRGALAHFVGVIRRDPDDVEAWNDLGAALHAIGERNAAMVALENALRLSPQHKDALLNLGFLYAECGAATDALSHARAVLAQDPNEARASGLLATYGAHDLLRPLVITTAALESPLRTRALEVFRTAGVRVGEIPVNALAHLGPSPDVAAERLLRLCAPPIVVIAAPGDWKALVKVATEQGIPVVSMVDGVGAPRLPDDATSVAPLVREVCAQVHRSPDPAVEPLFSLIVPTYDRHAALLNLLDSLALQDLHPRLFEVVICDDGSPVPVDLADQARPFWYVLLRQDNAGPSKARNECIRQARGKWLLILNDDAVLVGDNVRRHLLRQLECNRPVAILGRFDFNEGSLAHPVVEAFQAKSILFPYSKAQVGQPEAWTYFWTCNISVPRAPVVAVGMFDEDLKGAVAEDVELGYRLQKRFGVPVVFDPNILAEHDHVVDIDAFMRRQYQHGVNTWQFWEKHKDPEILPSVDRVDREQLELLMRIKIEDDERMRDQLLESMRHIERVGLHGSPGSRLREEAIAAVAEGGKAIGTVEGRKGILAGMRRWPKTVFSSRPAIAEQRMSVVMPNLNGFPHLSGTLDSLRRTNVGPLEIVVVDNGSTDGSLEFLREQKDVVLLEMGENKGAPTARNRGLEVARGETILFSDNDVIFTPRWREILCSHLGMWPDIGIVGPTSDYVVPMQRAPELPDPRADLDRWATAFHRKYRGQHSYTSQLILFCMLARRDVVEKIGGIDEAYNPWGFEDNDYCLRAYAAGFQLRIARDCFIRHLGSRTAKSANIDYDALLNRNWEIFKRKWGIPTEAPYGTPPDVLAIRRKGFDAHRHVVPLTVDR